MVTSSAATQAEDAGRDVALDFMGEPLGSDVVPVTAEKASPLRQAGKTQYSTKLREF